MLAAWDYLARCNALRRCCLATMLFCLLTICFYVSWFQQLDTRYLSGYGQDTAAPRYLEVGDLVPEALRKAGPLPIARVDVSGQKPAPIAVAPEPDSPFDLRKLALWGVLLLGTAVLAFAAIRLARASKDTAAP